MVNRAMEPMSNFKQLGCDVTFDRDEDVSAKLNKYEAIMRYNEMILIKENKANGEIEVSTTRWQFQPQ